MTAHIILIKIINKNYLLKIYIYIIIIVNYYYIVTRENKKLYLNLRKKENKQKQDGKKVRGSKI